MVCVFPCKHAYTICIVYQYSHFHNKSKNPEFAILSVACNTWNSWLQHILSLQKLSMYLYKHEIHHVTMLQEQKAPPDASMFLHYSFTHLMEHLLLCPPWTPPAHQAQWEHHHSGPRGEIYAPLRCIWGKVLLVKPDWPKKNWSSIANVEPMIDMFREKERLYLSNVCMHICDDYIDIPIFLEQRLYTSLHSSRTWWGG